MEILGQIQADLLDHNIPLSAVLRKAKVLAAELGSEELAAWVSQELDGYKDATAIPDYRVLKTSVAGTWTNGYWTVNNHGLRLSSIDDEKLRERLTTFVVHPGIRTIEQFTKMPEDQHFMVSPDITAWVNTFVSESGYGYSQLHYSAGPHNFEQILDTVRNRLLDFILKLGKKWNPKHEPPAQDEVSRLVSVFIYNNPQGGSMSVFDQRGQHVQYQFNAAGNINLERIQSSEQLHEEIEKLRGEIDKAKQLGAIPQDTAVEAEYQLLEASREAMAEKPNRSKLLEKIDKARELLKDISSVAGLVAGLVKLTEIVMKLVD